MHAPFWIQTDISNERCSDPQKLLLMKKLLILYILWFWMVQTTIDKVGVSFVTLAQNRIRVKLSKHLDRFIKNKTHFMRKIIIMGETWT